MARLYKIRGIATRRKTMKRLSTVGKTGARHGAHCPFCPPCTFAQPKSSVRCDGHVWANRKGIKVRCSRGHEFVTA